MTDASPSRKIRPDAAILPGRRDPLLLMTAWFARKSVYSVAGLASLLAALAHRSDVSWGFDSPAAITALVALLLRVGSGWLGLALAYPLTVAYEAELEVRTGFGSHIGKWLDRRQLAKGFRALRWTHHIRQAALRQLGTTGERLRRIEPFIDVANIVLASGGAMALAIAAAAA